MYIHLQRILIWTSHILSVQEPSVASGYHSLTVQIQVIEVGTTLKIRLSVFPQEHHFLD